MKLIQLKALILSFCAAVILFEVANAQNKISADESWSKLNEADFTASYPSQWKLDQSGVVGTKFIISDSELIGGFRANTTLLIQDLKGTSTDLTRYFELSKDKLMGLIANIEVVNSKRIKTVSGECQEFVFKGDQGVFHLKWRQRYWIKGDKAYVLTFTASQVVFEDYALVADKILNLFTIK